ncbi:sensor histidine kinase [Leeia oryzae]|uniref:sensor histidine kinase n=1 Tax=Leeia oryzae TaxID=356662 RepID=UPI000374D79B|nr:ATP-binding protein [Leeia oryzae]
MKPIPPFRWLAAWLLASLLAGSGLYLLDYGNQRGLFSQDSSIGYRLLSQKLAQQEAVLATLALIRPTTPPQPLLTGLQPAMPQLAGLGFRGPQQWQGTVPAPAGLLPALTQARHRQQAVTLAVDAYRYWLVDASGWCLLLDARRWLAATEWPARLDTVRVTLPGGSVTLLQRRPDTLGWGMQLDKHLQVGGQSFGFQSAYRMSLVQGPWLTALMVSLALALGLAWWRSRFVFRQQQRQTAERNRLAALHQLGRLGEMAAGIAHELNQPLTAILTNVQAAERLLDDEEEREHVRHALQTSATQAKRAAGIISRLRDTVGNLPRQQHHAVDVPTLIHRLLALRQDELAQAGIRLTWQQMAADSTPQGDSVAIEQILHNLVQNAAEALHQQPGEIRIVTRVQQGMYRLEVQDSGPGIDPAHLALLFQPFFTTRQGGMGLGLSLCDTLAQGMGGQLQAANQLAGGACFSLLLPLSRETRHD